MPTTGGPRVPGLNGEDEMSCGARNGYNDVCGETYTCPTCMMGDEVDSLRARIAELERVLGEIDKYWFDPASGGACGMCDANLHENAEKKHKQLNGDPCPIQVAHEALAEIKSVLGKGE